MPLKFVSKPVSKREGSSKLVPTKSKKVPAKAASSPSRKPKAFARARQPIGPVFSTATFSRPIVPSPSPMPRPMPMPAAQQRVESGKCPASLTKAAAPTSPGEGVAVLSTSNPKMPKPRAQRPQPRPARQGPVVLDGQGYLRIEEVLTVYPVSRAAWYAGMAEGIYPPSPQLGKRSVGWSRASIRELIANPPKF